MVSPLIQEAMRSFLAHQCQLVYDCAIKDRSVHVHLALTCRRMNQRRELRNWTRSDQLADQLADRLVVDRLVVDRLVVDRLVVDRLVVDRLVVGRRYRKFLIRRNLETIGATRFETATTASRIEARQLCNFFSRFCLRLLRRRTVRIRVRGPGGFSNSSG
ncbi:hypothetical protein CA13_64160 [Planctomycetes bacterium CA13]|uniref:Uncharacterized protein n=1 Tax=Novipirellula herctigrandis TaxID=2527986 RepID=A0A5C5ZCQ2_9BACT|nr:hypothetical protein CA13_64160 [Planctomycetes bacterium CA13]